MGKGRYALVIGNSNYAHPRIKDLPNARKDALHIAEKLQNVGFIVTCRTELTFPQMEAEFTDFVAQVRGSGPANTVLFYFAGHGYQENDHNYLLPVYANDAPFEAVILQSKVDEFGGIADRQLVFLDACRSYLDTVFVEEQLQRSRNLPTDVRPQVQTGPRNFDAKPETDTYIAFSAAPGNPAYDGTDEDGLSPFAHSLGRFIEEVDLPLSVMMARVRNSVFHDTEQKQRTWDSSSLSTAFFFAPSSLLFLIGNLMALLAMLSATAIFGISAFDYGGRVTFDAPASPVWVLFAACTVLITTGIFILGIGRAYSRIRGAVSSWRREGRPKLFQLTREGVNGSLGGMIGALVAGPIIAIPYWQNWRTSDEDWRLKDQDCANRYWADPEMPEVCPRLSVLLVETGLAGFVILGTLGYLAMHIGTWNMARSGHPEHSRENAKRFLIGSVLGSTLAGMLLGPVITMYFGALDRPFLDPSFVWIWSIFAIAIMAFFVVNYSLERFTAERLRQSLNGAAIGTATVLVCLGASLGFLYLIEFIQVTFKWAQDGFHNKSLQMWERLSYLAIAGFPYGVVFGTNFGILMGITRVTTEKLWTWR